MKRFVKKIAAAGAIICVGATGLSLPVGAESFERDWTNSRVPQETQRKGFLNSFLPAKKSKPLLVKPNVPTAVTTVTSKNKRINIKQPVLESANVKTVKTKPTSIIPLKVKRVKTQTPPKRKITAAATKLKPGKKSNTKQAAWWRSIGNPAVFAFRDCSVKFATNQAGRGVTATPSQFITSAMKTSCRVDFAKMAGVLIGGLGEERSNAMLAELAKTTFLPSVKAVLDEEKSKKIAIAQKKNQVLSSQVALQTAKAEMFKCFSRKADHLSIAKNTGANFIADSVIIGCQNQSDAFFDLLFANSKANAQVKQQQKNIALNETYRVAIIRRVLASRKPAQIKTATGVPAQ